MLGKKKKGLLSEGYLWILLAVLFYGASLGARENPALLEKVYPAAWNRALIRGLSRITGPLPFSLGEAVLYAHVALGIILLILFLVKLFKGGAFSLLFRTLAYASILYIIFMVVFGLNYHRPSVRTHLDLEKTLYEKESLMEMNEALIEKANSLRAQVAEDEKGVFLLEMEKSELFEKALESYDAFSGEYPVYQGTYGPAKGVFLSEYMNYTGITGVFMPFTGEANVNTKGPDLLFPATVLHEMAHQRGVAYEDEANFMAYVTSQYHKAESIRYSGTMLALISSMNALYRVDREAYRILYDTYSDGVKRDLKAYSEFYKPYEGKVQEQATKVNDTYLKSNGQVSGVRSYGEMVNLLLEQFMQKGTV